MAETEAHSADYIVRIPKNPVQFPSPVRAVGSNHSMSPCGAAEGGTLVKMKMNRILNIAADTIRAEAGGLTRDIVSKAFGERLEIMAEARKEFDPQSRLLNEYFSELFACQPRSALSAAGKSTAQ